MAETARKMVLVQFDVGAVRRFRLEVNGTVVPTAGLACQVRLQRVSEDGGAEGDPITATATADDAEWWSFTWTAPMTAEPGDYEFEARIDNGAGEIKRFPDEEHNVVVIRPVRTGGTA